MSIHPSRTPPNDIEVEVLVRRSEYIERKEKKMCECFHCGHRAVIWDADFNFEDMGYEGDGFVNLCHCTNCGAQIEYRINLDEEPTSVGEE